MTFKKSILKKDIIIIIPAKNEYHNLLKLLKSLKKYKIDQLIIDDNSSDNTDKIKDFFSRVKIIKNKTSYGYDYSIKKGLRIAKLNYKYAITMDADFEHDPKYIQNFLNYINKFDLIIGERNRKNRIFEKIFSYLIKKKYQINDLFCGYRAINLKFLDLKNLLNNSDLPSIIFNYHKLNQNTLNIKINSVKRIDKSRFGNAIVGNYKILIQFLKIFLFKSS